MKEKHKQAFRVVRFGMIGMFSLFMASLAHADGPYDLIFKTGTLDAVAKDAPLEYTQSIEITNNKEQSEANTGTVRLTFQEEDMSLLQFLKDTRQRKLGEFPTSVGNPMVMYFAETVIRDMASTAGGSPFYIRNRVKASLLQQVPINDIEIDFGGKKIAAKEVILEPFKDDPNRDRMKGFEDLALTITVSEDVPGWYYSMKAETANKVYSSNIKLQDPKATQ